MGVSDNALGLLRSRYQSGQWPAILFHSEHQSSLLVLRRSSKSIGVSRCLTILSRVSQTRAPRESQRKQGGLRPCLDKIEALEWASDSDLLLCAMYKRSLVEVCGLRV